MFLTIVHLENHKQHITTVVNRNLTEPSCPGKAVQGQLIGSMQPSKLGCAASFAEDPPRTQVSFHTEVSHKLQPLNEAGMILIKEMCMCMASVWAVEFR